MSQRRRAADRQGYGASAEQGAHGVWKATAQIRVTGSSPVTIRIGLETASDGRAARLFSQVRVLTEHTGDTPGG